MAITMDVTVQNAQQVREIYAAARLAQGIDTSILSDRRPLVAAVSNS